MIRTTLVKGVAWPEYTPTIRPSDKCSDGLTNPKRVFNYIDENPGETSMQISKSLNIKLKTVIGITTTLKKAARITSKPSGISNVFGRNISLFFVNRGF